MRLVVLSEDLLVLPSLAVEAEGIRVTPNGGCG